MGASQSTGTGNGSSGKPLSQHIQEMASSAGQFAANTPQNLQSLSTGLNQTAAGITALGQSAATLTTAAQGAVQANKGFYDMVQAHVAATQGKVGGGRYKGGYFGGDSTDEPSKALKEYRDSLAAATKDRIVRGLARALSRAGIDVNPDASAEEIARALQSKLPNPRKGKTFAADAKAQEKVCSTIADVLNDEFTPGAKKSDKLIDTSLGAVSVCRQVAEIVYSLSMGLHTEFLEVYASLTRVLRNLEVLDEVLSELHSKIGAQIRAADLPTGADKKIADFEEVYARAQRERSRQMSMLRNFLSVTLAPAKEELAIAMRDKGEEHDIIKRLKLVPGTGDFADSLAQAVSGLGTVAAVSARVDKALQDVGLSVQQYLSSADMSTLEETLDSKLMTSGEVDADDVGKFLKAVQTLKENFYRRSELDFGASEDAEMVAEIAGSYEGGRRGRGYRGGEESTLDKRVKKRKMEKKLIVKEFINKSSRQYDALLEAVQVLGPQLGKTIPLSDELGKLRNALAVLSDSHSKEQRGALSLELALLGYYPSAESRQTKENFLSSLRVIQGVLDDLMGMEMYRGSSHYFAAIRAAIDGLVRTIDFYSDVIAKKYGSGDGDEDGDEVTGGVGEDDYNLSSLPEIARSSYDLDRAVNTFLYFYYVAKVRANLAQTHKELEFYGEKYVDILGDAVAARLRQLEQEKKTALEAVTTAAGAAAVPAASIAARKTFIENEYACKVTFYKALQALDLYMKAFTDGIVAHPDDVADVKRMVDGISVIGRWFVEETGDDLAAAFDMMPAWDGTARRTVRLGDTGHYYEKVVVEQNISGGYIMAGVPEMAVPSVQGDSVYKEIAKVFDNFQALKNITNAFVRIGEKFGGKELRRMVFMSPTQIYKAFLEYMKCSALSLGVKNAGEGGDFRSPVITLSEEIEAFINPMAVDEGLAPEDGVYFGSVRPGLEGNYVIEDRYFTFCVKAMAAKVLTVIGVFDLFERPSPVYELTPTRMIIGGADYNAIPMAIPEASELYFRLPRLVEFYKSLFDWEDGQTQISMLPEMEGIFSGIIHLIFNRVQGGAARSGNYSDLEVRQIVREVNMIYENFKGSGKSNAISEALSAFVMEINRRYGVVKKKDWDALQTIINNRRRGNKGGPQGTKTNYAILPGEDEYESDRRAPADRYLGPGAAADNTTLTSKFSIDGDQEWAQWNLLKNFRERLDAKFASVNPEEFTTYSFSTVIRQGELEMRRAEGDAAKIGVATRLIQGSSNLAGNDVGKSFMFHETVVVGLNILSGIYTQLDAFRQRIIDTDVVRGRKELMRWVRTLGVDGVAVPTQINHALLTGGIDVLPRDRFTEQAVAYVRNDDSLYWAWGGCPPVQVNSGEYTNAGHLYTAVYWAVAAAEEGNPVAEGVAATLATYAFNDINLMRDLLLVINGLTSTFQGLVTVRFPGTASGQLHLDFSGLRNLILGLMNDVRYFLDLFRPHIAKSVITKYEDRAKAGSLYWLEEHLIDGLVSGLPDDMTQAEDEDARVKTLEWMSRMVNRTYSALIGYNRYTLARLDNYTEPLKIADGGVTPIPPDLTRHMIGQDAPVEVSGSSFYGQYGWFLSELVFYNASAAYNSKITTVAEAFNGSGIDALISTTRPRTSRNGKYEVTFPNSGNGAQVNSRIKIWNDVNPGLQPDRSMVINFNQLLAKYLAVFYDSASGRIYRSLIDGFANGSFSRAVMTEGHTLPDIALNPGAEFGTRGDPAGSSGVLFQSLGLIIQRLVTDINPSTQISDHLVATLSEIPLYMRESYRANLPGFIKLFDLVQKEGEFYKQLMAQTAIQVGRDAAPPQMLASLQYGDLVADDARIIIRTGVQLTGDAPGYYSNKALKNTITPFNQCPIDSKDVKSMLVKIIDSVAAGCYSISNAAAEVLREIADEPLYLQTHENSIQEYKARYGKMPLMPLSSALTILKDVVPTNRYRFFPEHSVGDPSFKLMYGTRKLLGRPTSKFSLADAPGVRAILDAFNSTASGREKIDEARFEEFLTNAVSGLRFLVDIRFYRSILNDGLVSVLRANLTRVGTGIILNPAAEANAAYSVRSTPEETLAITESSYQDQELKKISNAVGGAVVSLGEDRTREWIYNIIDMNIIPINVHALMRGIPLAPLYNYVFTFEQMACLMLGETVGRIEELDVNQQEENGVRNTRQMMLKLLLEPYTEVNLDSYGRMAQREGKAPNSMIQGIFRGDDSLMMGRPKFLSDQIYNKALFGSLIPTMYSWDEAGPPASGRLEAVEGWRPDQPAIAIDAFRLIRAPEEGRVGIVNSDELARWRTAEGTLRAEAKRDNPYRSTMPDYYYGPEGIYGALTFIGEPDDNDSTGITSLKRVKLGNSPENKLIMLEAVGKARFDTRIVRNLFFITNIQRLMRLKLNQELTQYRNVLVSNHSIVNPGVTEYGHLPPSSTSNWRLRQYGPGNETSRDRRYDNETRLVA